MERLITRAYVFGAILIASGVAIHAWPKPKVERKTEEWMQQHLPTTVGKYVFYPPHPGAQETSRMDQSVYDILKPFGIVCRVYQANDEQYEVAVIASQSDDSFHDPRVCFSAQKWTLGPMIETPIPTKKHGTVYATITEMTGPPGERIAAFLYKGPNRFYPTTAELKWVMLFEQLRGNNNLQGVFYRFIPLHSRATKEDLVKFIGEYLDVAHETSDGFF